MSFKSKFNYEALAQTTPTAASIEMDPIQKYEEDWKAIGASISRRISVIPTLFGGIFFKFYFLFMTYSCLLESLIANTNYYLK